jgi:hypothetical protein
MSRWWLLVLVAGCGQVKEKVKDLTCGPLRDDLASQYQDLIASNTACETTADCHAPLGACEIGFGGCQEAVNKDLTVAELEAFEQDARDQLSLIDCEESTVTCDCYGGYDAECQDNECVLIYVGYAQ